MGDGHVTRRYHRETSQGPRHWPRPGVPGFEPMDPLRRPEPFKRYPDALLRDLPTELPARGAPAALALSGRVPPADGTVDLELLARLLYHSAGVVRTAPGVGGDVWFRAAPSAGNLHPLEVYAVAGDVAGLDAGLYHFAPDAFGLEELSAGDHRAALADTLADPDAAARPLLLVLTGIPWRTAWKYAERGWRHVYWDAGTMLANLLAVADGYGLPSRVLLGFVDAALCRVLGVDGVAEFPVAVVVLGAPTGPAPPGRGAPTEPEPSATPLSAVEFPLIAQAQRAGDLATADEVGAWRAAAVPGLASAPGPADPPPQAPAEPIESVILRRGSTRRMRRGTVPADLLRWPMAVATRGFGADAVPPGTSPLTHQLAVHAVEALASGCYEWVDGAPRRLRAAPESEVREVSARVCLGQALGGDSAYTDFISADLDRVLDGYGDRGYRLAQLAAGVAAGRAQLAAFALGYGGTGLTFADEEIPAVFGTTAAGMLVASIGIPAYRPRPGGPPGRPTRISR
ncbi:MAG: SagB family peptide dehydrogenase [Micromonosporaceae bacterium]